MYSTARQDRSPTIYVSVVTPKKIKTFYEAPFSTGIISALEKYISSQIANADIKSVSTGNNQNIYLGIPPTEIVMVVNFAWIRRVQASLVCDIRSLGLI